MGAKVVPHRACSHQEMGSVLQGIQSPSGIHKRGAEWASWRRGLLEVLLGEQVHLVRRGSMAVWGGRS